MSHLVGGLVAALRVERESLPDRVRELGADCRDERVERGRALPLLLQRKLRE
jgi:hypothetical protein